MEKPQSRSILNKTEESVSESTPLPMESRIINYAMNVESPTIIFSVNYP